VIEFLAGLMGAATGAAIVGLVRGSRVVERWAHHRKIHRDIEQIIAKTTANAFCDKCGRWFNARDGWHRGPLE
jgi:hypothetical protein